MHQFDTAGIFTLFFESKMPSSWSSVHSSTVQPIVYYLCFSNSHGWSGGVMVLGKFPAPGCPTNLDCSGATRNSNTKEISKQKNVNSQQNLAVFLALTDSKHELIQIQHRQRQ